VAPVLEVASNNTFIPAPLEDIIVAVNFATGDTQTTTVFVALAESPHRLKDTKRTLKLPLVEYVWLGVAPDPVVPSPKYHFHRTVFAEEVDVAFRTLPLVVWVNKDVTGPQTATVSPNTAESPQAFLTLRVT
jgi:hypothetical protein